MGSTERVGLTPFTFSKGTNCFFFFLNLLGNVMGRDLEFPRAGSSSVLSNRDTKRNRCRLREGVVVVTTPCPFDIFQEMNIEK